MLGEEDQSHPAASEPLLDPVAAEATPELERRLRRHAAPYDCVAADRSADANAPALAGRSDGSFASVASSASVSAGDQSARAAPGSGGSSSRCAMPFWKPDWWANGVLPAAASYTVQPRA